MHEFNGTKSASKSGVKLGSGITLLDAPGNAMDMIAIDVALGIVAGGIGADIQRCRQSL